MTEPLAETFDDVLLPEEVDLVDEYLSSGARPGHDIDAPAVVYVLHLGSGAVYVGISKALDGRVKDHARNAKKTPLVIDTPLGPNASPAPSPSATFLMVHGDPNVVAVVSCPTRRHALLYEAILTEEIASAGVHVFGSGWSQHEAMWTRNEVKGRKLDSPAQAAALVAATP
jgi:hypothetical protein